MARERVFSVYDTSAHCEYKVAGVKDLAEQLKVLVEAIPHIRLSRYVVGDLVVTEIVPQPEQSGIE